MKTTSLHKSKNGFTLMELMVVVVIMGVLASLGFRGYGKQAAIAMTRDEAMNIVAFIDVAVADVRKSKDDMSIKFDATNLTVYAYNNLNCVAANEVNDYELRAGFTMVATASGDIGSIRRSGGKALAITTEDDYLDSTACVNINGGVLGLNPMSTPGYIVIESNKANVKGMIMKPALINNIKAFYQPDPSSQWMEI